MEKERKLRSSGTSSGAHPCRTGVAADPSNNTYDLHIRHALTLPPLFPLVPRVLETAPHPTQDQTLRDTPPIPMNGSNHPHIPANGHDNRGSYHQIQRSQPYPPGHEYPIMQPDTMVRLFTTLIHFTSPLTLLETPFRSYNTSTLPPWRAPGFHSTAQEQRPVEPYANLTYPGHAAWDNMQPDVAFTSAVASPVPCHGLLILTHVLQGGTAHSEDIQTAYTYHQDNTWVNRNTHGLAFTAVSLPSRPMLHSTNDTVGFPAQQGHSSWSRSYTRRE